MDFKEEMMVLAQGIKYKCLELGWVYDASNTLLTITKELNPNTQEEYEKALTEYNMILDLYPDTNRLCSVWVSTNKKTALTYGKVIAHKSGGKKTVLKALNKM